MKTIVTTLTITVIALFSVAPIAEARGHRSKIYISGYTSCGSPIYYERYFVGYDDCGQEIWQVRRIRQAYRPAARVRYHDDDYESERYYGERSYRSERSCGR
ncbi:MAG: hypothetical protein HC845_03220 [Akkermansiaceae bacterium]|nr:hypothetical protein [Akkermansiaceae bacterium]